MSTPDSGGARVLAALRATKTATFCTFNEGTINARCMLFACDGTLRHFYLLTHRATDKLGELEQDRHATLLALALPADGGLEGSAEATVKGMVTVGSEFREWVPEAVRLLAEKQPQLEAMVQAESLGDYRVLRLDADCVIFRTYAETLANAPKTVLRPAP